MSLSSENKSARRLFVNEYGVQTRDIIKNIVRGYDSNRIADELDVSLGTVAAVRANVTRGTYFPFVEGTVTNGFTGACSF